MKNFDYLRDIEALQELYVFCNNAEETQRTDYNNSALNARRALEWIVKAIYKLKHIELDPHENLYELMTGEPFTDFIANSDIMMAAHYVRKIGNKSAHTGDVSGKQAFFTLLNLYNVVGSILLKLRVLTSLAPFDKNLVPEQPSIRIVKPVQTSDEPVFPNVDAVEPSASAAAAENTPCCPVSNKYDEAETRKQFIDLMLEEAGWEVLTEDGAILPSKACIEIEVHGMPNAEGVGYADYVLFGANGKPLAVVEAKRTSKDPIVGKQQAILYADCLEKQYGQRPVIYYTNGFTTYIIDGLGYPPRTLTGFHTENDLNVLLQRRNRTPINDLRIKDEITNREYQKRAVRSICEHFNRNHRRGLLVMATGTGKTRVAVSLTDVLMRNGWVKNVLFLADRITLVNQACKKSFAKLLPDTNCSILSERDPDINARILFCTYQTMINFIDTETKEFSVGRFDLIIIDEAHRSVFGKYAAILNYFDALIVGLTATPRDEVDKSTYDLFQMENGEPNFDYGLKEAVEDGYLVDYVPIARGSKIIRQGIKYADLSPEEKEQMKAVWAFENAKRDIFITDLDTDDILKSRDIQKSEIFKYIFNIDTVDKVLQDLMENGLKVSGGDVIGKTIIFAYNHQHAQLVVERFYALYPELGSEFCALIDNTVNYAQSLIDQFSERERLPQIAVSVDMLDTGVDVPDILNLVFFKPIHSPIKFWQMIGRGTRLSPDIFDEGEDKKEFYIFDWYGNFEYFGKNPKGKELLPQLSLTEKLFGLRADLACALQNQQYQQDEYAKQLHDETKAILMAQVNSLNDHHISVRSKWESVVKFRAQETWNYISALDVEDLKRDIAPLLVKNVVDEGAKRFDILILNIQLSLVDEEVRAEKSKNLVQSTAMRLQDKASIPQVLAKMELINEVSSPVFWENLSLSRLEYVRKELRDLIQFLSNDKNRTFTLNITDVIEDGGGGYVKPQSTYKQRVIDFLAENEDLPVIQKIVRMEKLSPEDIKELERICWKELGTKEDYEKYIASRNMICGDSVGAFIRAQIGVDRHIAMERFSKFLSDQSLNTLQEEYIKTIILYVCQNGDISPNTLIDVEPFSNFQWIETFGQNLVAVRHYVDEIHDLIA